MELFLLKCFEHLEFDKNQTYVIVLPSSLQTQRLLKMHRSKEVNFT